MEFEDFFQGYLVCALWSSLDENGNPLDDTHDTSDYSQEAEDKMREDCRIFYNENRNLMYDANTDFSQHGHDFWLSRNGHGAGFWDRGNGEIGERLHKAAQAKGSKDLYIGDDGFIYMA